MATLTTGTADLKVVRSRENYLKIITDKLVLLPWGQAGLAWLDMPNDRLDGSTPRERIESENGQEPEFLVEELEAAIAGTGRVR